MNKKRPGINRTFAELDAHGTCNVHENPRDANAKGQGMNLSKDAQERLDEHFTEVAENACDAHGCDMEEILSPATDGHVVRAREDVVQRLLETVVYLPTHTNRHISIDNGGYANLPDGCHRISTTMLGELLKKDPSAISRMVKRIDGRRSRQLEADLNGSTAIGGTGDVIGKQRSRGWMKRKHHDKNVSRETPPG